MYINIDVEKEIKTQKKVKKNNFFLPLIFKTNLSEGRRSIY
jgi:hypothetical protein